MGYELDRLMKMYGVNTPSLAAYSGSQMPGAPPAETATADEKAKFDESVRRYQLDRKAYEQYKDEYLNRIASTNLYDMPQFKPADYAAPAPRAPLQMPTYGAVSQFANLTPQQQGDVYRQQRELGYTDADIRKATAAQVGTPSEEMMAGIYKTAYPQFTSAIESQYGSQFNRSGYGTGANQIDYPGFNYYINQLASGAVTPATLESAIRGGAAPAPTSPLTPVDTTTPVTPVTPVTPYVPTEYMTPEDYGATPGMNAARGGYIDGYAEGGTVRTHYQSGGGIGDTLADLDEFYSAPSATSAANLIGRRAPGPLPTVRPISRASANDPRLLDAAIAELSLNRRNVTPAMIEQVSEQYGVEPAKISERLNLPRASNVSSAPRPAAPAAPQNTASESEPLADWRRAYEDLPVNSTDEWSRAYAELPANNPMEDFSRPPPGQTSAENPPAETATQPEPQSTGGGRSGFEDLVSRYMGSGGEYSRELAAARQRSQAETDAFSNLIKQMSERGESPASRSEMYFRLAAAFGSPTRTGKMGETLSKVGEQMGEYTKGRRADEAERRGLLLKAQEIKMAGAREDLATAKALAAQESADRRSMAKELVKEYIASRRPQSDAGKLAEDAGYKRGTPEYNDYVQRYIRNKEENGDFYRRAVLELRMADERRKLEKETELSPTELKMKADQLSGLSAARMALEDVREALRRNQNSYGLSGTDYAAYRARALSGSADEKVLNTQMIENLLTRGAIDSLKEKFGAGITNEERRALVNLAGADAATRELRESILRRTERELELSLRNREKQLEEISSGAFRKMTQR